MIVDSEDEFHPKEIEKLHDDVLQKGLSLIVFADWYNASVIKAAKFFDENTRQWWTPVTGGANLPALNSILEPFGIGLGDRVYEGEFAIGDHSAYYASGTSIVKYPKSSQNYLVYRDLIDQSEDFLASASNKTQLPSAIENIPILGLAQTKSDDESAGRVVVYGDSNCIDSAHLEKDCFWLLSAMLEYAHHNVLYAGFRETNSETFQNKNQNAVVVKRSYDENFYKYSKILRKNNTFVLDTCESFNYEPDTFSKSKNYSQRTPNKE